MSKNKTMAIEQSALPLQTVVEHNEVSRTTQTHRFRTRDSLPAGLQAAAATTSFEEKVFRLLEDEGLFDKLQREVALAAASNPSQAITIVDAIAQRGRIKYVVEVKLSFSIPKAIISQLRSAMDLLTHTAEVRSILGSITVRGLLITEGTGGPSFLADNIASLCYNSQNNEFVNVSEVRKWILMA